ncbi:DNA-directed RNA polymerase III subunit RPC9 isoform X1 [Suricata suricatta]|uniref:DNA-directed RNA polymerase III subunit RPC9 isoform X1 n=1 Tax=Suricata suricatta TaxID=37032 RepID=UPI0011557117|nr:DNA-directed RNA polymerase III subunit RPC9 isoform X1 [Suricata suricatta]
MEVKDASSALLSNYEVFQLLTDLKEQRKESGKNKHSSGQQNLNTITYETLKYISKTPCRHQSPEIVREFLTAMKSHKLTKAEKLQLLNHRPMTAVEIQLWSLITCMGCTALTTSSSRIMQGRRSRSHTWCKENVRMRPRETMRLLYLRAGAVFLLCRWQN